MSVSAHRRLLLCLVAAILGITAPQVALPAPAHAGVPNGGIIFEPGYAWAPGQKTCGVKTCITMQWDGNFVVYKCSDPGNPIYCESQFNQGLRGPAMWATNTWRPDVPQFFMTWQTDHNLVMYNQQLQAIWASNTYLNARILILQADGNLVIYDRNNDKAVWATNTYW